VHEYSPAYEESQAFSPHFCAFAERLARDLIDRYDLHGKEILEIGCGKGDFLLLLAERGGNHGVGIDPGFRDDRLPASDRVRFIRDFYSERYADLGGDFICCRHTLEHIQPVREFVALSARSARPGAITFYEVPDTTRVLAEGAFWDIYYEHCSYFTLGSLGRLFRACGLAPLRLYREFEDQYLCIDARAGAAAPGPLPGEDDLAATAGLVERFAGTVTGAIDAWRARILAAAESGHRVVLWGSGSKGVAFLTTLRLGDAVRAVVDINPHRQGRFMPGSGHEIVAPDALRRERPDLVVVMNPVYVPEISAHVRRLGLEPEVLALSAG
jgi:SAM-dependent methyltransferase